MHERADGDPFREHRVWNRRIELHIHLIERTRVSKAGRLQTSQLGRIRSAASTNQANEGIRWCAGDDATCFSIRPLKKCFPDRRLRVVIGMNTVGAEYVNRWGFHIPDVSIPDEVRLLIEHEQAVGF